MNVKASRAPRAGHYKSALMGTAAMVLLAASGPARADEHMVLVDTIGVGDGKTLGAFDISFVDPTIGLYVLADRTNGSVDLFDATDATFSGRVGGFAGVVINPATGLANNNKSGPDGVIVIGHKEVWAGDGDSTLKVIDLATKNVVTIQVTDPTDPTVKLRVDEMAYDEADHILAAANNANTPPFITLINTDTHDILGQIVFDKSHSGVDAQNGVEQPQWSSKTGMFYVSVPQVGPDPTQGGVAVIDPTSMKVTAVHLVQNCSPAGLAVGPRHEAMIGCGGAFGAKGAVVTQSIIMNLDNGDIQANITQAGGNDEVWYDKATQHYYLAARGTQKPDGTVTPILGTVDAKSYAFDGGIATSTTAHSVAADPRSHHVFVPIGFVPPGSTAGTDATNPCPTTGCIAVYLPSSIDDDDGTRIAKH
jgi:hypothetical protein